MSQAVLIQAGPDSKLGYQGFGAAETFWNSKAPEVVMSGPYETGKTLACLQKLNALLAKYPDARALMVRKTKDSLYDSAIVTYENKVLPFPPDDDRCPVRKYGGERPQFYIYPNGSRLILGGMDPRHRGKTLSAEYDFIYVNQAEELMGDDWEALTRAVTGRAGNAPYTQLMADCNPDVPEHWLQTRERLLLLESRHEDNPMLYDRDGNITAQGKRTMETLDAMTGVRYKRGRLGLWVGREGQVYDFDPAVHAIDAADLPSFKNRYRVIDFGFTNPFVCQWLGEDYDGRLYLYREIYMSQRTVKTHAGDIKECSEGEQYGKFIVCDHDAEDRATLHENELLTIPAKKSITRGIQAVQERLKLAADGKPRLFIVRGCTVEVDAAMKKAHKPTSTQQEFGGYVWPERKAGRAADEHPIKTDDHGMDALRYMVVEIDGYPDVKPLTKQPTEKSKWGIMGNNGAAHDGSRWRI